MVELTGRRFGRLVVLHRTKNVPGKSARWACRCDCGNDKIVSSSCLLRGDRGTRSCGCVVIERGRARLKDLTGQRFGRLTVIRRVEVEPKGEGQQRTLWACRCDCDHEVEKVIGGGQLTSGHIKSCGCLVEESKRVPRDLTGQKFGMLTVVRRAENRPSDTHSQWLCQCECGNEATFRINQLTFGNSRSCGCLSEESGSGRLKDLTGRRFGKWTVLHKSERLKHKATYWVCQCDCESRKEIKGEHLLTGASRSCGCFNANWKGCGDIPGSHWSKISRVAKERGIGLEMTIEEAWTLFLGQDRLCALSGLPIKFGRRDARKDRRSTTTASLDRIDSGDYYRIGNVQWVHKTIQKMKQDLDDQSFILFCKHVAWHNRER